MALTRITKGVIKPNENYDTHDINSTGIVTAVGLDINGNADISGNFSVGGVLTYEDVTSIDSVGLITARSGIKVGSGVTIEPNGQATFTGIVTFGSGSTTIDNNVVNVGTALTLGHTQGLQFHTQNLHSAGFEINQINASGVITATSFVGSGAALTGIDATSIKDSGGNVKIQAQASGAIHSGVSTFQDLDVDGHTNLDNVSIAGVVTATSFVGSGANLTSLPIGGSNAISLNDNVNLNIGTGNDGSLFNSGSYIFLKNHNGNVAIQASGTGNVISLQKYNNSDIGLQYVVDGSIKAYYNNSLKFTTETSGVNITGVCTATSFVGDGSNLTGIVGVPTGCILLWSGAANAIPSGFVLCNGSNSTPDLRGKFVVGYHNSNGDYDVGDTGGAETVTLSEAQIPSHNHSFSSSHTHGSGSYSTNTTGSHSHTWQRQDVGINNGYRPWPASNNDCKSTNVNTGSNGNHSHSITGTSGSGTASGTTGNKGGGNAHENRPPYYALCYIMKT